MLKDEGLLWRAKKERKNGTNFNRNYQSKATRFTTLNIHESTFEYGNFNYIKNCTFYK